MTIRVTYNTEDIATYISLSYENPSIDAVWGQITGTLSNQTDLQNALDAKVPYTGATTNVNLGEFELKAGQMTLDITPTGTAAVGTTRWNDTIGSSETTLKGGSVILKNGVDLVARVVNKVSPNTTLTKAAYQAVRISGAQGQRLAVALAQANNDNNSADTIGLVTETIATNQEGFIMTVGSLEGINTTGSLQGETWADGDVIYLSPTTAGALTNVKPIAPQHIIVIGYVEYAHANNGKLYVKVMNGWELGELHDVDTTGATNGQVLKYNGTIWTPSGDVGITSLNGLNATSQTFATGTSGTDFNISSATSTHTFNLPTASGTNRGLLSSADWTTFNSKQNALTNPITGTAAAGQVAYFTGATTQAGSNNLFWDASNNRLGVGTASPSYKLDVQGTSGTVAIRAASSTAGDILYYATGTVTGSLNAFTTAINATGSVGASLQNNNTATGSSFLDISVPSASTGDPYITFTTSGATNWSIGTDNSDSDKLKIGPVSNPSLAGATTLVLHTTGNTSLGSTTDSGQRLQVTGDTLLRGSGNGSGTTALTVQNSDGTNILRVRNNGQIVANSGISVGAINTGAGIFPTGTAGQESITLQSSAFPSDTNIIDIFLTNGQGDAAHTSGTRNLVDTFRGFNPTSGTGIYNLLRIRTTINQTGGANGITRGLYVNPTLTAAADWRSIEWSNNTGWGLYGAGTANNYLGGSLGIGSTTLTNYALRIGKAITGNAASVGIGITSTISSDVTSSASLYYSLPSTQAATFTLTELRHFEAGFLTLGSGSTITNQSGFFAGNTLTQATNNYGFYGSIASGTGRWNFYAAGTANNYMAGSLGIGATTLTGYNFRISKNLTGFTTAISLQNDAVIQSDVQTSATYFRTIASTQAASFTLSQLFHYAALQGTFGAGSTVNNQYGFYVANLSTGPLTYGFYGDVASGTDRWNLYMAGTAANFVQGNLLVGTASNANNYQLYVVGGRLGVNNGIRLGTGYSAIDIETGASGLYLSGAQGALNHIFIHTSGNTLLGSTTNSGEKLQVTGTAKITGNTSIDTDTFFVDAGSNRVGIGTISATAKLHVLGSLGAFRVLDSGAEVHFSRDGNNDFFANGGVSSQLTIGANTNLIFKSGTGLPERMRLDASGNLGIGNTPTAALDVKASTTSAAAMRLRSGTAPTTPNDGDIWFDGTDLKMRIGGVTKTFTLI
jgi:hypothetical protein